MSVTVLLLAMLAPPPEGKATEMYTPIGSLIPRPREAIGDTNVDTQRAMEVLQKFGKCVVGKQPLRSAAFVDPPRSMPEETRRASLVHIRREMSVCLGRLDGAKMQLTVSAMLGTLAEHLYQRKYPVLPPLGRSDVPPMAHPEQLATWTTLSFANCLIDRDAASVDAAVRAVVNSREEGEAFGRLSAHYSPCLDAGSALRLNRLALRSALAEQLYRRATAGPAIQSATARKR